MQTRQMKPTILLIAGIMLGLWGGVTPASAYQLATVIPSNGPAAGGNTILVTNITFSTLRATDAVPGPSGLITNVLFDTNTAAIQGRGANWAQVVAPAHAAGNVLIRIQTESGGSPFRVGAYTYNPAGQIGDWVPGPYVWTNFGAGMSGNVCVVYAQALGTNGELYAGGIFETAGDIPATNIAKWDGTAWTNLGAGIDGLLVRALALGTNGELYAGGKFETAGDIPATNIAKWDGTAWTNLGAGLSNEVRALALGTNGELYAGGEFTNAGGTAVNRIAKWDGTAWTNLGAGLNDTVYSLAFGTNGELYVGGSFTTAGDVSANNIAKWDGTAWTNLGEGFYCGGVYALAPGTNGELYAGGCFTVLDGGSSANIAKWDGTAWTNLDVGMDDAVHSLALGTNNELYAGGDFTTAGGMAANHIAKWNPATAAWTNFGAGMDDGVYGLAFRSNGDLYAVGCFTNADTIAANHAAKYGHTSIVGPTGGVSPSSGSCTGGYPVVICGENLCDGTDVTNVTLCGVSAADIVSQSATQIVITAMAGVAGVGDARVYSTSYGETVKSNAFTYLHAGQTIDFPAIGSQWVTNIVHLTATASSGLPVSFAVVSGAATISDATNLSFTATGQVSVKASQTGDASYAAAPDVTNTFDVLPVPNGWLAIQVTPTGGTWQLTAPAGYTGPSSGTGNLAAVSAPTGLYALAWGALSGYVAPSNQTQCVTSGSTSLFTGVYTVAPIPTNGWLAIQVTPTGGAWQLAAPAGYTGPMSGTGNLAAVSAPTGLYALAWGALSGYTAPGNQSQFVTAGNTTLLAGVYLLISTNIGTPEGVSATEGSYTNKIRITWQGVAGALGYEIWRSQTNDPATAGRIADIPLVTLRRSDSLVGPQLAEAALSDGNEPRQGTTDNGQSTYYYDDCAINPILSYFYWVRAKTATLISPMSYVGMGYAALDPSKATGHADLGVRDFVFLPVNITNLSHAGTMSFRLANYGPDPVIGGAAQFDVFMLAPDGSTVWIGGFQRSGSQAAGEEQMIVLTAAERQTVVIRGDLAGLYQPEVRVRHLTALNDPNPENNTAPGIGLVTVKDNGVNSPGRTINDYDGDGRSDMAVCDENMLLWGVLMSSPWYGVWEIAALGTTDWLPVAGDYDGDGKTDPAVYRPTDGFWLAWSSSQGYRPCCIQLGAAGCVPTPADYDGDGKTDPAIYWTEMGYWRGLKSGSGYAAGEAWVGGPGYRPMPGDYDGDGKADIMLYAPATSNWQGRLSSTRYELVSDQFGGQSFQAAAADFDGDGKTDPAVYEEASGMWYILLSTENHQMFAIWLGAPGYAPAAGDYDGDGIADPAVYGNVTGIWYGRLSSQDYRMVLARFGGSGYRAVSE